jgi:hypothetical protein
MRKLILLVLASLASLAFMASAASAAVQVSDPVTEESCAEVVQDEYDPFIVDGGCLVEGFEGGYGVYAQIAPYGDYLIGNVESYFDLRVGSDGSGFAVNQYTPSGVYSPCDDADLREFPWPVEVSSVGGGDFQADVTLCLRHVNARPGTGMNWRTITVDVTAFGGSGGTSLDQVPASGQMIQGAHWDSNGTVDIADVP